MRGDDNAQSNLRNGETTTDLLRELVGDLRVSRYCLDLPGSWVTPKGMFAAFSFEIAAVLRRYLSKEPRFIAKQPSREWHPGGPRAARLLDDLQGSIQWPLRESCDILRGYGPVRERRVSPGNML